MGALPHFKRLEHVLIVGAGPGGLAAALTLKKHNIPVTVFESTERDVFFSDVGGGYDLSPNVTKVMTSLGLAAEFRSRCKQFSGLEFRSGSGQLIRRISVPPTLEIYSALRSTLQHILLEALGEDHLRCGAKVASFSQDESAVEVQLTDGSSYAGDVLLGADGIGSVVRAGLLGKQAPHLCDCVCWWGRVKKNKHASLQALPDDDLFWFMGEGRTVVGGNFRRLAVEDEICWAAFHQRSSFEQISDPEERKHDLVQTFADWEDRTRQMIINTDADTIIQTGIWDRTPVANWVDGRVALLGDAAHPMTPFLGQGANSAIIDAFVLGSYLADRSYESAFMDYENRRIKLINENVMQARSICKWMMSSNVMVGWMIKEVFRWFPERLLLSSMMATDRVNDLDRLVPNWQG